MVSSCHISVIDNNRNRCMMLHTKTTLHPRRVNRSPKIIQFSHLNSTMVIDNFMREKLNR